MGTSAIGRLKGVLVSACQANKDGHRDIFENLMEIASDTVEELDPEVLESHIFTIEGEEASDDFEPELNGLPVDDDEGDEEAEDENHDEDMDDGIEVSNHGSSLADILGRVGKPIK